MTKPTGRPTGVRLSPYHSAEVRAKIQCSQLINRLTDHVNGKVEMTPAQVQSAKILLDKGLSNAPTDMNVTGNMTVVWPLGKSKLDV